MNEQTLRAFAPVVLRFGLSFMFLWFGFSQLFDASSWLSWVPDWATVLFSAHTVVLLNGGFEVLAGTFLALGLWVRPVALLLALHLFVIVVDIGLSGIGVRDFGLATSTLALALGGSDWLTLDRQTEKETFAL